MKIDNGYIKRDNCSASSNAFEFTREEYNVSETAPDAIRITAAYLSWMSEKEAVDFYQNKTNKTNIKLML